MRSFGDLPRPVLVLEGLGAGLLPTGHGGLHLLLLHAAEVNGAVEAGAGEGLGRHAASWSAH